MKVSMEMAMRISRPWGQLSYSQPTDIIDSEVGYRPVE
jgi:hypothetical protein